MIRTEANNTHELECKDMELELDAMKAAAGGFDTISAAFRKHLTNSIRNAKKQGKSFEQFCHSFYSISNLEILSDYLPQLHEIWESC